MLNKKIKKTPLVFQYMETECGLACLSILFKYFGIYTSLQTLREQAGVSRDGCKATTLISLAQAAGCKAEAYSVDLETLYEINEPVILHWNFSHYIVFEGIKNDKVYINDPANGRQVVTLQQLDSAFTGIVIAIQPTPAAVLDKKQAFVDRLKTYFINAVKNCRWLNLFALMVLSILPLILTSLNSVYINHILLGGNTHWLRAIVILCASVSAGLMGITLLQSWLEFSCLSRLIQQKTAEISSQVLQWPILIFQLRPISEFIVVMNSLETGLRAKLEGSASIMANGLLVLVLSVGLFMLNPLLAGVVALLLTSLMITMLEISRRKKPLEQQLMNAEAQYFGVGLSFLNYIENIVLAGMQASVCLQWQRALEAKLAIQQKIHGYQAMQNALTKTYQSMNFIILLLVGLLVARGSQQPLSLMLAFAALTTYLSKGINTLTDTHRRVQTANAQLLRVDDVSRIQIDARFQNQRQDQRQDQRQGREPKLAQEMQQLQPQYKEQPQCKEQTQCKVQAVCEEQMQFKEETQLPSTIRLHDLAFSYNKTQAAVIKIDSLVIHPKEHIAFVGGSGSGKSTLAKLLAGLYLPDRGEICFDQISTTTFHPADLAKFVSVVTQEASVLSLTLYENLTLGNANCPPEKVHEILQWVGLENLVHKRGLNTLISANNHQLSGGEVQRINLARALIQDAPILILDEATSSLDIALEAKIIEKIKTLNKTVIYIAHRLSTIQHCDRIIVLQHGEIIESGTHASLLVDNKVYASFIQAEAKMTTEARHHVNTRSRAA